MASLLRNTCWWLINVGIVGRIIARKLSISQQLEIDENVVLLVEVVVTVVEVVSFKLE